MTVLALLVAVVLLAGNAFFTAVEFALVAASRSRLEVLAESGNRRARVAVRAMGDLGMQLAGAQLGLTMTALGLGYVVEPAVARLLDGVLGGFGHGVSVAVAIAIVVFAHVLIGEMVPKNAALCNPDGLAMWLAPVHRLFVGAFRPVIRALEWLVAVLSRLCGVVPVDRTSSARTPAELSELLAESRTGGLLTEFEHTLLASALELGERPVASIMVPRERICAIPRAASVAEAEATVVASGHSRLLLGDPDRPEGFVHAKDLLTVPPERWSQAVPAVCVRRALMVRRDLPLEDLLRLMRRHRVHVALVREGTVTVGLVTLEDVLESLVGDIRDESDVL
ncbi:MAG: hemolysin family protein [bacterium]|nr:hemolysin family protein [bacterium]MCY3953018.1 hemolysin family protein [bacterium]MCY4103618.1 hemolysin family protein [bacterium]